MKLFIRRVGKTLVPASDFDYDMFSHIPEYRDILCTITVPRNLQYHKMFFAVLRLVVDNMPDAISQEYSITTVESLLDRLKIDLGEFTIIELGEDKVMQLNSISFCKMDQSEFQAFFNRSVDIITKKYLPGVTREQLLNNI